MQKPNKQNEPLSKKQVDAQAEALFKKYAHGVQFNIFDVGKVLAAMREAVIDSAAIDSAARAEHLDHACVAAVARYRVN